MNNYCVFEDKKENKCNCDEYCPNNDCINFISKYDKDGNEINNDLVNKVVRENDIKKLEELVRRKKLVNVDRKKVILKKNNKSKNIFIKNDLNEKNIEEIKQVINSKKKEIEEYDKFLQIIKNKGNVYSRLNNEIFIDELELSKNLLLKKIDKIREKSEYIEFENDDFEENKKSLEKKINDFDKNKKSLIDNIKRMDGEINADNEIMKKRKNDLDKLNKMLDEDKKEIEILSDETDIKCKVVNKKCPDNLKKIVIILTIFAGIIYYSLYKINY